MKKLKVIAWATRNICRIYEVNVWWLRVKKFNNKIFKVRTMGQGETVERILHAAGILFAERGFAETSLRTITGMAEVNLAAVNYHFGSKKSLIQAVFANFLNPFCMFLEAEIDRVEAEKDKQHTVDDLLECIKRALVLTTEKTGVSTQRITRLLSLGYMQSQEHLRKFIVANFGHTYARFTNLLRDTVPDMDPVTFYWHLYFMLGAAVFTLSSFDSLKAILSDNWEADSEIDSVLSLMIPSLSSILKQTEDA